MIDESVAATDGQCRKRLARPAGSSLSFFFLFSSPEGFFCRLVISGLSQGLFEVHWHDRK